jgi:hypothetical protein
MTVGVEHHGRLQSTGFDPLHDPRSLVTGIDHRQSTGLAITEQNTVRLDRADWEDIEEKINHHKFSILNS